MGREISQGSFHSPSRPSFSFFHPPKHLFQDIIQQSHHTPFQCWIENNRSTQWAFSPLFKSLAVFNSLRQGYAVASNACYNLLHYHLSDQTKQDNSIQFTNRRCGFTRGSVRVSRHSSLNSQEPPFRPVT